MKEEKGKLNSEELKQIGIKLLMLAVATVLPVAVEQLKLLDFGQWQPVVTMVIFGLTYTGQLLNRGK